jgi:hypothetical protein
MASALSYPPLDAIIEGFRFKIIRINEAGEQHSRKKCLREFGVSGALERNGWSQGRHRREIGHIIPPADVGFDLTVWRKALVKPYGVVEPGVVPGDYGGQHSPKRHRKYLDCLSCASS